MIEKKKNSNKQNAGRFLTIPRDGQGVVGHPQLLFWLWLSHPPLIAGVVNPPPRSGHLVQF